MGLKTMIDSIHPINPGEDGGHYDQNELAERIYQMVRDIDQTWASSNDMDLIPWMPKIIELLTEYEEFLGKYDQLPTSPESQEVLLSAVHKLRWILIYIQDIQDIL